MPGGSPGHAVPGGKQVRNVSQHTRPGHGEGSQNDGGVSTRSALASAPSSSVAPEASAPSARSSSSAVDASAFVGVTVSAHPSANTITRPTQRGSVRCDEEVFMGLPISFRSRVQSAVDTAPQTGIGPTTAVAAICSAAPFERSAVGMVPALPWRSRGWLRWQMARTFGENQGARGDRGAPIRVRDAIAPADRSVRSTVHRSRDAGPELRRAASRGTILRREAVRVPTADVRPCAARQPGTGRAVRETFPSERFATDAPGTGGATAGRGRFWRTGRDP